MLSMIAAVVLSVGALGPTPVHVSTAPPTGARYEVVQSTLAARWTFRLDRFTGEISELVVRSDGSFAWQRMEVSPAPVPSSTPRYQLFLSGFVARDFLLLDTQTGRTWNALTYKGKLEEDATGWFELKGLADSAAQRD